MRTWGCIGDDALLEGAALHLQVGLDLVMGGVGRGVAEPGLDGGEIHAGLKQMHRLGVPQGMWGDGSARELWFGARSGRHGSLEDVRHAMARQSLASCVDEERSFGIGREATLVTQCLEELRRVLGEEYRTLQCSLAAEQDLRWSLGPEVCRVAVARL